MDQEGLVLVLLAAVDAFKFQFRCLKNNTFFLRYGAYFQVNNGADRASIKAAEPTRQWRQQLKQKEAHEISWHTLTAAVSSGARESSFSLARVDVNKLWAELSQNVFGE